jgi:hypothetical protein
MRRMSIGNGRWFVVGIILVAIIVAGGLLFRPSLIRASYEEDPEPEPTPGITPATTPKSTPAPTVAPTPKPTPIPTLIPTPSPCPPYPPDNTEVIPLTWIDEGSITIPLPLMDNLTIPLDYSIEGSATFEINNSNPSIKIPDEIEITSGNVNLGASLPAVGVSASVSAESSAKLIDSEFFASVCGDGGVMVTYKAKAEATIEITLNVSILFWETDVYTWEFLNGDNIPITINSDCVYCPKGVQ